MKIERINRIGYLSFNGFAQYTQTTRKEITEEEKNTIHINDAVNFFTKNIVEGGNEKSKRGLYC